MAHGTEAARRVAGASGPGAYRLTLGSDVEGHSRLSAMMVLVAGKLLALESPYRLFRAVVYPTCHFLDQAHRPSLARAAHPFLV